MCSKIRVIALKWKVWIQPFLAIIYLCLVLTIVPLIIFNSIKPGHPFLRYEYLFALTGGAFVLLAVPISVWQITQHVLNYTKPILQKHIVRILWMVPIYAINAWAGLVYPEYSMYMDSFRECYEAYVIYNFMKYLLNYLNLEMDLIANLERKPPVAHFFPLCCLAPWDMGREFVHMCKHGILQYTVVRPITTAITVICEICEIYEDGDFNTDNAYPYILAVNNASQFIAMYCLVLFYKANRLELRPMKPIGKFLCIKAVVFFSFFQGVLINILVTYTGIISTAFGTNDKNELKNISSKLQDFLICIEMFFAALAHHYSFSYEQFVSDIVPIKSCCESFIAMWDISDVHQDITEHLGVVGNSLSRRIRGKSIYRLARSSDSEAYLHDQQNFEPAPTATGDLLNESTNTTLYATASSSSNIDNAMNTSTSSNYGSIIDSFESAPLIRSGSTASIHNPAPLLIDLNTPKNTPKHSKHL